MNLGPRFSIDNGSSACCGLKSRCIHPLYSFDSYAPPGQPPVLFDRRSTRPIFLCRGPPTVQVALAISLMPLLLLVIGPSDELGLGLVWDVGLSGLGLRARPSSPFAMIRVPRVLALNQGRQVGC